MWFRDRFADLSHGLEMLRKRIAEVLASFGLRIADRCTAGDVGGIGGKTRSGRLDYD